MALSLDSRALEVFLAVCDAGTMTGAARQLGITQGAVSQQIGRLEAQVALPLLAREGRELRLLPAGLHLRHHARRVVENLRDAERSMQRFKGFSFPRLSIGMMETLAKTLAGTVVDALQDAVETIQVKGSVTYRHREELMSGNIDMVITAHAFEGAQFEIHPLVTEPVVLIAPPGHIDRMDVDLDRLSGVLPLVRFATPRSLGKMAEAYLAQKLIVIDRSIVVDQMALLVDSVRQGRGWALTAPSGLLDPLLDTQEFDILPLPAPAPRRTINLVTHAGRFGHLPALVAERCRNRLVEQIAGRLSIAPQIVASIEIPR